MATFVPHTQIENILKSPPTAGKTMLEPFQTFARENKLPFKLLEDTEVKNDVEVHRHEGDLWYCLEGEATFVCGGELVGGEMRSRADGSPDDKELFAKEMKGGTTSVVHPGDWLWIPAGETHQHSAAGTARLAIIKIPQAIVPLSGVAGWV